MLFWWIFVVEEAYCGSVQRNTAWTFGDNTWIHCGPSQTDLAACVRLQVKIWPGPTDFYGFFSSQHGWLYVAGAYTLEFRTWWANLTTENLLYVFNILRSPSIGSPAPQLSDLRVTSMPFHGNHFGIMYQRHIFQPLLPGRYGAPNGVWSDRYYGWSFADWRRQFYDWRWPTPTASWNTAASSVYVHFAHSTTFNLWPDRTDEG